MGYERIKMRMSSEGVAIKADTVEPKLAKGSCYPLQKPRVTKAINSNLFQYISS
jgi:hypothetical protein